MRCFYFDVVDREGECIDEDGLELPDLGSAQAQAIDGIRSILSSDVRDGSICLSGHVRVRDEAGDTVLTIPFSEAVALL